MMNPISRCAPFTIKLLCEIGAFTVKVGVSNEHKKFNLSIIPGSKWYYWNFAKCFVALRKEGEGRRGPSVDALDNLSLDLRYTKV
jgi:hypothetical protein